MMLVTVHLGTILQKKTPRGNKRMLEVSLDKGSSVADLIRLLELEIDPEQLLLAVNGRVAKLNTKLENGHKVHLMMPISGG